MRHISTRATYRSRQRLVPRLRLSLTFTLRTSVTHFRVRNRHLFFYLAVRAATHNDACDQLMRATNTSFRATSIMICYMICTPLDYFSHFDYYSAVYARSAQEISYSLGGSLRFTSSLILRISPSLRSNCFAISRTMSARFI